MTYHVIAQHHISHNSIRTSHNATLHCTTLNYTTLRLTRAMNITLHCMALYCHDTHGLKSTQSWLLYIGAYLNPPGESPFVHVPTSLYPPRPSPRMCNVCMYGCMDVWMYGCMDVCTCACMHICMYACVHVCMSAYVNVCQGMSMHAIVCQGSPTNANVSMYACLHARMYNVGTHTLMYHGTKLS